MANRLKLLLIIFMMPFLCSAADFNKFKAAFISADGRVIDKMNGNISHSEGQGYGMLLSLKANDRKTFDKVYAWTVKNLQIRETDSLFAWRYGQDSSGVWKVTDNNNATDGDILIAYSLILGSEMWNDKKYLADAKKIISDIRIKLTAHRNGMFYLLPGEYGFSNKENDVVNPSYIIISAYKQFGKVDDPIFWKRVQQDGIKIIAYYTGQYIDMPRNWLRVTDTGLTDDKEKGVIFGFDAVRCLLYGSWSKTLGTIPGLKPYLNLVKRINMMPMTVDMSSETMSMYDAPAGFYSVLAKTFKETGDNASYRLFKQEADKRILTENDNYYSYALYLLSEID